MASDKTVPKQLTPWLPGESGNPAGRPKGSRNKLGQALVEALHEDFLEHGVAAVQSVRSERPHEYLKIVASLLPKELHVKDASLDDMTDDELIELLAAVRSIAAKSGRAKTVKGVGAKAGDRPAGEQLN